jgi:Fe2+ transport system protein B
MADKDGWVYVLTNEAMPGIVKIGYTFREPSVRAEELYKDSKNGAVTGVPLPFNVAYKAWVINPYTVEQSVHKSLAPKRLNQNREFFKCSTEEAIQYIRQVAKAKFEESKQEADRRLRLQKELEEKQKALAAQQEAERQRLAKKKAQQEAEQRLAAEVETREKELVEKAGNWKGASQTGCGTLILNILVALILLVSVPWVVVALFGVVAVAFESIIEIINKTF